MIKGYNKYVGLVDSLHGFYTLETLADRLKINRTRAIYVIHRLRKLGYVKTSYGAGNRRLYSISLMNKQNRTSYLEEFNKNMPNPSLRIRDDENYFVYGRKLKVEEELIYALNKKRIRYVISCLFLFRKIEDWHLLYNMAKKENLSRQISALYDVARIFIRKVRRMPERFRRLTIPKKNDKYIFIVDGFSSDDFKEIERKWKVYIPLNRDDLEEYNLLKYDKHK